MPELAGKAGEDIVTSSGDTLLGADDKAGSRRSWRRSPIWRRTRSWRVRRCGSPSRRTRRSGWEPSCSTSPGFGAMCAYTLDGSTIGELQDETFTAAEAIVAIRGVDVHPGFATGKLVNAARLAARVVAELPSATLTPETTSGREGFIHVYELAGTARARRRSGRSCGTSRTTCWPSTWRCCGRSRRERRGERAAGDDWRSTSRTSTRTCAATWRRFPEAVERPPRRRSGPRAIEPIRNPIRGGTDGSRLSADGPADAEHLRRGHEFHSVREWVSVQDMAAAAAVIVRLARVWSEPAPGR